MGNFLAVQWLRLFVTPWTVVCQAPSSMGFPRQEYWSRLPFSPPGDLPDPGIEPTSLPSPVSSDGFFTTSATWEPKSWHVGSSPSLSWSEVAQSCPTLCDPMGCSLPGSSVHGISPGKNTGVGCHSLLQGIFPTQGSKSGLLYCRQTDNHLLHILDLNLDGYGSRARPLLPLTK